MDICSRITSLKQKSYTSRLSKHCFLDKLIRVIGKCSYDIYLFQMTVFTLFSSNQLAFIESNQIRIMLWMAIAFIASIMGGIILNRKQRRN